MGTERVFYSSMQGSASGILIDLGLGNGFQDSGPITFSLNPSGISYLDLNFNANTASQHVELLVNAPLLSMVGHPPLPSLLITPGSS
jgi:hypothetical protein